MLPRPCAWHSYRDWWWWWWWWWCHHEGLECHPLGGALRVPQPLCALPNQERRASSSCTPAPRPLSSAQQVNKLPHGLGPRR